VTNTKTDQRSRPRLSARARRWFADHAHAAYVIRRLGRYVLTLWGALTVAFIFFRLIPGDPVSTYLASLEQSHVHNAEEAQRIVDHYRELFGLNDSLFDQYIAYLRQLLVSHDLGPALIDFPTPSQIVILRALPWTIGLLGLSTVFSWILGTVLGVIVGWRRESRIADAVTSVALALSRIPYYLVALMLVYFFAFRLAWFPPMSAYAPSIERAFTVEFLVSVVKHGTLPALSIVMISVCNWLIITRTMVITTLGEDYLVFAEAKGLSERRVAVHYVLRNCWLPLITAFGIRLGSIFNGSVLVERLFMYPGLGNLLVQSLLMLDYNTLQGIVALSIFGVLTANAAIDLLLPILDPRVKY